jgi:hypothetical protein
MTFKNHSFSRAMASPGYLLCDKEKVICLQCLTWFGVRVWILMRKEEMTNVVTSALPPLFPNHLTFIHSLDFRTGSETL